MQNKQQKIGLSLAATGAMLFCSNAANAQSSVTLYGVLDVGVEHVNNYPGGALTRETSGNLSGSRWGLKITEDLGSKLSAVAVLESGINVNDGTTTLSTKGLGTNPTTTTRLFGRQVYVGLNYNGQQITLGRHNTPMFDFVVAYDPTAIAGRYSVLSQDASLSARADDSVKYMGNFGPVRVEGLYSTRYDTGYGTEVPGAQLTGREYSASVQYATGPFSVSVLYDQRNSNTAASNTASEKRVLAGATYKLGSAQAFVGYRYIRSDAAFLPTSLLYRSPGSSAAYSSIGWLGASYFVRPDFSLTGAAYYQDQHATSADPWLFVAIADYYLSKRTDIYGTLGYALNKSGSTLGVNGFGTVTPGHDQLGTVIGLRHKF